MAGRLTIRRVGHILPTVCLVVLLLLLGIITWLSTAGLPDAVLHRIEQEVTKATGLPVRIHKIKLSPRSGLSLKAEDVCLTLPQQDALPATVRISKTQVTFSLTRLLAGDYKPANLHILRLRAELPLSDAQNDSIILNPLNLYITLPGSKGAVRAELNAQLQGIGLQGKLSLAAIPAFSASDAASGSQDVSTQEFLKETLAGIRPWLRDFKQQVDKQKWEQVPPPHLNISAAYNQDWKFSLEAEVPSCILGNFHFTETQLKSTFEKNELRINSLSFRTVSPDSKVQLQASYNIQSRELSFASTSSAPFVQIINDYIEAETLPILSNIRSRDGNTPRIELNGSMSFSDDYALNSITLRALLEQKGLEFGNVEADNLLLSFFLRDGSFNLDQCRIDFPDGHLQGAAQSADGKGRAELELSLPAGTILNLARNISGDSTLSLPEGLEFKGNLEAHLACEMKTQPFEAGKSRLEDLLPALSSCEFQFRTSDVALNETQILSPGLHLKLSGIDYSDAINVAQAHLRIRAESAQEKTTQLTLDQVTLDLQLGQLHIDPAITGLQLGRTELKLLAGAIQRQNTHLNDVDLHTSVDTLQLEFNQPVESLSTSALDLQATLKQLTAGETRAEGMALKVNIPTGLDISEAWLNMQRDTHAQATVQRLTGADNFNATDTRLELRNNAHNSMQLQLTSNLGEKLLELQTTALFTEEELIQLSGISLQLPAAELRPLLGGEPLQELRLPELLNLNGDALIAPDSGRVLHSHFNIRIPELVRVCNNVFVHKGMEIPLKLDITGDFSTAGNGDMMYKADITATHADGTLDIHVTGDPLKECRITGTNTIPVSTVNALIDDVDAHWIMRDFRCVPGVTRNVISDIDTTIRYDRGIYVRSLCKANLYNMDFQLGAIRDKEDAQGNPTGEEFLRTDLGRDPFTRIKEGHCDVEVVVQLDCTDADGKPLADIIDINLLNPDLLYDNRPWLRHAKIKNGTATSRITGKAVRFDIEKYIISLHKLKGACYPAYAIGMYYAPLNDFLSDIVLEQPADIETDYCVFPISSKCEVPMQGLIQAASSRGAGFKFLGTTIPLRNFSGFINISDTDVYLDRLNAQSWGGVLNGALRIGFSGQHTTLDGYFAANNLNLKDIVASYGTEFTPATCNGFIRFQAPKPDLDSIQAYGQVHLQDGDLMEMALFRPIEALITDMPAQLEKLQNSLPGGEKIKLPSWSSDFVDFVWDTSGKAIGSVGRSALKLPFANHFLRYGIKEAHSQFDIVKGHLITRNMKASGYNLDIGVQLDIDLNNLTFRGDLWPHISSVPTVLISPVTLLSDFLIDINLYGDILDPQWEFGLSKKLKSDKSSLSSEPQEAATNKKQ